MNPPFSGSLHLDFLDKVTDICENIVSVQPATFLINIRTFGKPITEYNPLKDKLENHVINCEIDNMNDIFGIGNKMPITILGVDMKNHIDKINFSK